MAAADAIISALGTNDYTANPGGMMFSDGFIIPSQEIFGSFNSVAGHGDINARLTDDSNDLFVISKSRNDFATPVIALFEISGTAAVSLPPTLALAGMALALMGFMGSRRRVN